MMSSKLAVAHGGHHLAHFFGDEEEVVDDVLRRALEALAQHRVLGGDAHRAGVQVALAHHDAASRDQRRGRKAELVGAQQRADDDVAAGAQAAVDLQRDARAQAVEHQRLVGFGKADFPRAAGMLDGGQRRRAGAAVIAGDGDVVGARLGDAGGHRADADFGHQLDRDVGRRVDVLQIEDQLRQILDRVDVVVRRRRDQADARRRVAHLGDVASTLWPGSWPPSPGLAPCATLIWIMSALTRYSVVTPKRPEATCLIAERSGFIVAVGQRLEAVRLLAAFAGVGLAADPVHGHAPASCAPRG
jgi:hypothetical protein